MASESLHEEKGALTPQTIDMHRAIASLMEELEAVDWYQQRVDATTDPELKAILAHNRDEEIEHACMALEWLRRRVPKFAEELESYLFTEGPIVGREAEVTGKADNGGEANGVTRGGQAGGGEGLGIGSLKGKVGLIEGGNGDE